MRLNTYALAIYKSGCTKFKESTCKLVTNLKPQIFMDTEDDLVKGITPLIYITIKISNLNVS